MFFLGGGESVFRGEREYVMCFVMILITKMVDHFVVVVWKHFVEWPLKLNFKFQLLEKENLEGSFNGQMQWGDRFSPLGFNHLSNYTSNQA